MQIYQSTDPLDAPDFDPVSYINEQVAITIRDRTIRSSRTKKRSRV